MSGGPGLLLAGVALALAALLLHPGTLVRRPDGLVPAGGAASRDRPGESGGGAGWFRRRRRRRPPSGGTALSLGVLCTQVASRLRSGAGVAQAWQGALVGSGVGAGSVGSSGPATGSGAEAPFPVDADGIPVELLAKVGTSAAADAVVVACRLAMRCGTPLAEILDECAHGITEVEAADADRRRALAGPAATARLLVWLPAASLILGAAMGADPVGAVLAGGPAALSLVAGGGFLLLGRWWIRALVRTAERAGSGAVR